MPTPARLELPPDGTVVGGFIARGRAENEPMSNRTRVLLECGSCGGLEPRPVYYLRLKPAGCRSCVAKRRYGK